jgi:leader peptidase (prepilin peptidase)/N-methyltransferase
MTPAQWALAGGLLGLIAGSFLAVLTGRLPQGRGPTGRSACDQCGTALGPLELVPVLSFLWLRGRCRHCGAAIAQRHLAIELAAAAIGAALLWRFPQLSGLLAALAGWWLLALIVLDAEHFWLPDVLVLPLLVFAFVVPGPALTERLWGAAIGFGGLWLVGALYRALRGRDGLGGGDPKLLAALGALLGAWSLPVLLTGAALLGLMLAGWDAVRGRAVTATTRLPFGALLAGMALLLLWLGPAWKEMLR